MNKHFEIRACRSCGLRYPLMQGHAFGTRCPHCLGETTVILEKEIHTEQPRESESTGRGGSVLLDNIRSAWNVGSILRSADGFGFTHAYLCGITPTPEEEAVRKTSLGAENFVTWSYHKDAVKLAKGLKEEGWQAWALEEEKGARTLSKIGRSRLDKNTFLIVGNEVTGVDPELLSLCDEILQIPMRGVKKSFNVAVAFGVAAWEIGNMPR